MTKVEDISSPTSTKQKRIVNGSVAVALGLVCIILAASLVGTFGYYAPMISDKNNTISSLHSQVSKLNSDVANLEQQIASNNATINSMDPFFANLQKLLNATPASVGEITANLSAWVGREVVVEGNMSYAGLYFVWNYELSSSGATIGVSWQNSPIIIPTMSFGPVISANASGSYNGKSVLVMGVVDAAGWSGSGTFVNGTAVIVWTPIIGFIEAESIFVI